MSTVRLPISCVSRQISSADSHFSPTLTLRHIRCRLGRQADLYILPLRSFPRQLHDPRLKPFLHLLAVIWINSRARKALNLNFKSKTFFKRGSFPASYGNGTIVQNPWINSGNQFIAPFDQEFYLRFVRRYSFLVRFVDALDRKVLRAFSLATSHVGRLLAAALAHICSNRLSTACRSLLVASMDTGPTTSRASRGRTRSSPLRVPLLLDRHH